MSYTITAARYADAAKTSAIIETVEAGAVIVSKGDTPALWASMLAWGEPGAFSAPAEPVPPSVSETQFMRAATRMQFVTGDEAEAYLARGEIPAFVDLALDGLPDSDRVDGRLKVVGADTFLRADPMFAYLIDKKVATSDQVDDLFRLAATLI